MDATLAPGKLRPGRGTTHFPDPRWYLGLDLGQRQDHSALAVLHLRWTAQGRPRIAIRDLSRFPIGTSYECLHRLIRDSLAAAECGLPFAVRHLVLDAAGPGSPVVDRLRHGLAGEVAIRPVILTAGKGANSLPGGYTGVPRRAVVAVIQRLIAARAVERAPGLPGWQTLKEELLALAGDGPQLAHDDLAIATGLAAWAACSDFPAILPAGKNK